MKLRNTCGASTSLVVVCLVVLVLVGILFAFITLSVGGKKQAEHAVEAGALSLIAVASKQVGTNLLNDTTQNGIIEQNNFADLVNPPSTGLVNLLNYNKLIGQTMLVASNAIDDLGGTDNEAYTAAQAVIDDVQTGDNSIGQRLAKSLNDKLQVNNGVALDPTFIQNNFLQIANANPLSLAGIAPKIKVVSITLGYVDQYSSSNKYAIANISVNRSKYPNLSAYTSDIPDPKNPGAYYLQGYSPMNMKLGSSTQTLMGVTITPGEGPHLVASSAFTPAPPYKNTKGGLPPNAIQIVASVETSHGTINTVTRTVVAGALQGTVLAPPPSIPSGYIVVKNAAGINFPGVLNIIDIEQSPFNKELMTGVYLTNNNLFSTDSGLLSLWAAYNKNGQQGNQPSNVGIFDSTGQPATMSELSQLASIGMPDQNGSLCQSCLWYNLGGPQATQPCTNLVTSFMTAYGIPNTVNQIPVANVLAVEAAKATVISWYGQTAQYLGNLLLNAHVNSAFMYGTTKPGICMFPGDLEVIIGTSGLQKFPHEVYLFASSGQPTTTQTMTYFGTTWQILQGAYGPTAPPSDSSMVKSVVISTPGTIIDYLSQISSFLAKSKSFNGDPVQQLVYPLTSGMTESDFANNLNTALNALNSVPANQTPTNPPRPGSLIRRMYQIMPQGKDPTIFAQEIYTVLAGQTTVPLGQTFYIYEDQTTLDKDGNAALTISQTPPPNINISQSPDGTLQTYQSSYDVLIYDIDTPGEMAVSDQLFTYLGHTSLFHTVGNHLGIGAYDLKYLGYADDVSFTGYDVAKWTPSSGKNNLLGQLDFSSGLNGVGGFQLIN